jgi:hypothetical protein
MAVARKTVALVALANLVKAALRRRSELGMRAA